MRKKIFRTILAVLLIAAMPVAAYADYGSIQIDGYYDDWEDKPHTEVYNGNKPPDGKVNYVSLFRADDSIYVHIKFAQKNNQGMKNMVVNIFTNLGNESYWVGNDLFSDEANDSYLREKTGESTSGQQNGSGTEDENTAAANAETGGAENPSAGGATKPGQQENPPAGGITEPGQQENPSAGGTTEPGQQENPSAGGTTEPGQQENPSAGGTTEPGQQENPSAGGTTEPGQQENPSAGGTTEPGQQENPSAGETTGSGIGENPSEQESVSQGAVQIPEEEVLPEQEAGTWSFIIYQNSDPVGEGYYTVSEDDPGEAEFRIPLTSIADDVDGISDISMRIKKVGQQSIVCVGADTGPYLGVTLGAAVVLTSLAGYTYKRKKPLMKEKGTN